MNSMAFSIPRTGVDSPGTGGSLSWGVKKSFRDYVLGAFGDMTVLEPAILQGEIVTFPASSSTSSDGVLRFHGAVRFRAHHGMLDVSIRDPWIETVSGEPQLSVAHGSVRVALARLSAVEPVEENGLLVWRGVAARMAKDGGAVFNFPYPEDTELDPVSYAAPIPSPNGDLP